MRLVQWRICFVPAIRAPESGGSRIAFGNYVQIESPLRIGLLEAPHTIIHAPGDTALRGAKILLLADEPLLPPIEHISLAADTAFQDEFAGCMTFPENL